MIQEEKCSLHQRTKPGSCGKRKTGAGGLPLFSLYLWRKIVLFPCRNWLNFTPRLKRVNGKRRFCARPLAAQNEQTPPFIRWS